MPARPLAYLTLATVLCAASGSAQIAGRHDYPSVGVANPFLRDSRLAGPGIWRETEYLHDRIDRARDGGLITRREARRLHRETRGIADRAWRYSRDGLSDSERTELANQARVVSDAVTVQAGSPSRTR